MAKKKTETATVATDSTAPAGTPANDGAGTPAPAPVKIKRPRRPVLVVLAELLTKAARAYKAASDLHLGPLDGHGADGSVTGDLNAMATLLKQKHSEGFEPPKLARVGLWVDGVTVLRVKDDVRVKYPQLTAEDMDHVKFEFYDEVDGRLAQVIIGGKHTTMSVRRLQIAPASVPVAA